MIIRNERRTPKKALVALMILALLLATVAVLELTDTTYWFHDRPVAVTAGQNTKGEPIPNPEQTSSPGDQPTDSQSSGSDKKNNEAPTAQLIAPRGNFVSNHRPNLGGSPAPNRIASVCTTTSGATCVINFTKDGVTKSLPAQTTDRGGSTYWDWKLQDIGLTEGAWKVTATATLGSQSQSADDAINLEVAP